MITQIRKGGSTNYQKYKTKRKTTVLSKGERSSARLSFSLEIGKLPVMRKNRHAFDRLMLHEKALICIVLQRIDDWESKRPLGTI